MGHVTIDINIIGLKKKILLKNILIDTGATYTTISLDIIKDIGAIETPYYIDLELGDSRIVKAKIYVASIEIMDREGPVLIASFENAKPVIGVQALESLGLKVDPVTSKLEPTRPKGLAYFYKNS